MLFRKSEPFPRTICTTQKNKLKKQIQEIYLITQKTYLFNTYIPLVAQPAADSIMEPDS